jgi:two-component system sensor histidine kinase QseC
MRNLSIQARLLGLAMAALLAVGLLSMWLSYQRAVHEVDELVDAQLTQYVRILLTLAHDAADDEAESPHIPGHRYESRLMFQIWQRQPAGHELLLRSSDAPRAWPRGVARQGYSEARIGAGAWRFFAAADDTGEHVALAALELEFRDELAREIAQDNMLPYLVGLPILAVILWWSIRQGLAPLRRLEEELASRSPERLDALPEAGLPRELIPLVRTMNQLFGRVGRTLDNERRFTSDAAHELRTPLAALRMQLQVAQRTPDDDERQAAIGKALRGSGRMAHLVTQLLALARLEGNGSAGEMHLVDLTAIAGEVVADLAAMAADKGVGLDLDAGPTGPVRGNPDLIRALVRNLIDNALRYTPAGGRVVVSLAQRPPTPIPSPSRGEGSAPQGGFLRGATARERVEVGPEVILRVADNGPGVEPEKREKLGLRFHRFGPQSAEGVGLGLSIVRRIAELHGATLGFGDGLDGVGLGVEVDFQTLAG